MLTRQPPATSDETSGDTADVFVIFGITGDLARKMTLRSLYRLERRGLLEQPIVGVAGEDWTVEHLRDHAKKAIADSGETIDEDVLSRLAGRLDYVGGDFGDADTFTRLAKALGDAKQPVYYLEVPPSLFSTVVAGLDTADLLPPTARVVVEKPFGHDLDSAKKLAADLHRHLDESQLLRIDHFLGKMGVEEFLYLRFANVLLEPVWNRHHVASVQITLAEDFGVEDRGGFYDPVGALRDVVVNHMFQIVAAVAMEPPSGSDADALNDSKLAVFRGIPAADPTRYVRGQYDGYREIDGVASDSDTETYVALALEVDSWRWAGVPFLLRTGKRLPVTSTEVRLVFQEPPHLGFLDYQERPPVPDDIVVRIDPSTGVRVCLDALRADGPGPAKIDLDMDFAAQGGEGPTPYETLLHHALVGDRASFVRQDIVEETWRIVAPLQDASGAVEPYEPGSWGPKDGGRIAAKSGGWQEPWLEAS